MKTPSDIRIDMITNINFDILCYPGKTVKGMYVKGERFGYWLIIGKEYYYARM